MLGKIDQGWPSPEAEVYAEWCRMAARDAAMAVFHFAKTLDALKQSVGRSSTLSNAINHEKFRTARRRFRNDFKDFDAVRHAVAHAGEMRNNQKNRSRHAYRRGGKVGLASVVGENIAVHEAENLSGRTFTNTYEGKVVSLDISMENLRKLDDILQALLIIFPVGKGAEAIPGLA